MGGEPARRPVPVLGPDAIGYCAQAVDRARQVVVPTRRWYMLCADSGDPGACARIFAVKGRPRERPLALVWPRTADPGERFVVSPAARRLMLALWPGDLALALPWRDPADGARQQQAVHPLDKVIARSTNARMCGCSAPRSLARIDFWIRGISPS